MRIFLDNNGVSTLWSQFKAKLAMHTDAREIHVTAAEKAGWNAKADLSDIPTTLPADGGNADTLDGKHASDFEPYQSYAPIFTGNILDITEMGTYSCSVSDCTNLPPEITSWCYITMYQFRDAGYKRFICSRFNAINSDNSAIIYLASESYKDSEGNLIWSRACDRGNADTLDGKHASDFALKTDIPTTLPANGGNADTVGNKPISQILAVKGWYELDMNELKEQGSYIVVNAANCPPTPAWGTALVFIGGTGSVVQLYICSVETEAERMTAYIRHYTGDFWTPWVNIADGGNAATLESHPASDFALKTEIPTTLPANGGRADAANAAYHQVEHFLESGTDVLAYVTSDICPTPFNTIVRIINSPTCPTNYGYSASDNDFFYHIFKLDNSLATVKAFDIRGNVEFINSCLNGTWTGWVRCNDGGNADTANLAGALSSTPTNVCLRNLSSGTADVTTTNCPSGAWYGQHS